VLASDPQNQYILSMKTIVFRPERACPLCGAEISSAPLLERYEPVVVISCPGCNQMLWRPGLDEEAPLHAFDPSPDDDAI
jgi:hypothetical protein